MTASDALATDGSPRPAWASIDLDALARNLSRVRAAVEPAGVLAVVKADAYGHGSIPVAQRLASEGVAAFGVAFAGEGAALRGAAIETPILVLGPAQEGELDSYREHDLTPTISDLERLELWQGWAEAHAATVRVHLKVDTGMSRLGLREEQLPEALQRVRKSRWLELTGLLSHLAEADEPESAANPRQAERFAELVTLLTDAERRQVHIHLANSSGALYLEGVRHTMIRSGLALFGVDPAGRPTELEPVMSVRAGVAALRDVDAGARVGYGGTWRAERPSRLAVIPLGYGDGYPWRLSNRSSVLIGGRRAPLAGRVSMDMLLVDVTGQEVALGDPVVLLGSQGDDAIDAWELARVAGTIPWETLCLFGLRLPRRYLPS